MAILSKTWLPILFAAPICAFAIDAVEAQTSGAPSPSAAAASGPATGGAGGRSRAPATPQTQSPAPSSALPPTQQVPGIAPPSPQLPTQFSGGGRAGSNLALSPGTSTSAPGGGGKTLADCMGFWDPATHMTKAEWKAACRRTLNRLEKP